MAKWFTLAEVATLFDVSISTVKRWADTDKLETEAIPGGSSGATAAGIRRFARNYGPAALEAFWGASWRWDGSVVRQNRPRCGW